MAGIAAVRELKRDPYKDAHIMAVTARLCREQMFNSKKRFNGQLKKTREHASPALLIQVEMIMSGPTMFLENQDIFSGRKIAATTISQLIQYNPRKKEPNSSTTAPITDQIVCHHVEREAIYIAIKVHDKTHCKERVDKLHIYGLCISYDRLLWISKDLGNTVISMFETEGALTPPQLLNSLLMLDTTDNYDNNPKNRDSGILYMVSWSCWYSNQHHGIVVIPGVPTSTLHTANQPSLENFQLPIHK